MDQRIEVALKKEIPNKVEETAALKNYVEDDEEQLNSDDDISDYNDVLDTGDNILLGYYVKVRGRNSRARERKTSVKSSSNTVFCAPTTKSTLFTTPRASSSGLPVTAAGKWLEGRLRWPAIPRLEPGPARNLINLTLNPKSGN